MKSVFEILFLIGKILGKILFLTTNCDNYSILAKDFFYCGLGRELENNGSLQKIFSIRCENRPR